MAHFAELDSNNRVLRVIVVQNDVLLDENGVEQEHLGVKFCQDLLGGTWVQTSYNAKFRGVFAGIGYKYDAESDMFVFDGHVPVVAPEPEPTPEPEPQPTPIETVTTVVELPSSGDAAPEPAFSGSETTLELSGSFYTSGDGASGSGDTITLE